MYIRPLRRGDIADCASIDFECYSQDQIYRYLFPRVDEYPQDLRRWTAIKLRQRFVQQGINGFVMETEPSDAEWTGVPEILAYAKYDRRGNDEAGKKWRKTSLFETFENYLLDWELAYENHFLSRIYDAERFAILTKPMQRNSIKGIRTQWHLNGLAVNPKYQRRGIGQKLLEKLQKLAKDDGLPVTLNASVMGKGLYLKNGFKVVQEIELPENNRNVLMVWAPDEVEGKYVEKIGDDKYIVRDTTNSEATHVPLQKTS